MPAQVPISGGFSDNSPLMGVSPHKRELKQAVLVKLLNKTHPFGSSAIAVSLINTECIFCLLNLQKGSMADTNY